MNLGKYLFGIREEYFAKVSEDEKRNQFFAYNVLAGMYFILVLFAFAAGLFYGLVIFQSWILSVVIGLFFAGISFILLLLVLFLNMTTQYEKLYEKMTDNSSVIDAYQHQDLSGLSDEEAVRITQEYKMKLRDENKEPEKTPFHFSNIFTSTIKVSLVLIISCIVANGLELFIFHQKLNESMEKIRNNNELKTMALKAKDKSLPVIEKQGDVTLAAWTMEMVTENPENPFILIDCHSILMVFDVLDASLGKYKVIFDLLFALLFIIPLILVKKSRKYGGGIFLKEVALSDISTSLMFYLLARRKSQQVRKIIEEEDYETKLLNKQL